MHVTYTLDEIVQKFGGVVIGDGTTQVCRLASLANADTGDISFLSDSKYQKLVTVTRASALITNDANQNVTSKPRIIVDNPYAYFAKLSSLMNLDESIVPGVSVTASVAASSKIPKSASVGHFAVLGENVVLGENAVIGHQCVIEAGVVIGSNTRIEPGVVIKHDCQIGANCHIFSGAIIGADGFGYAEESGRWIKIPQVGRVIIHDYVDVGANTTIDRGALDDTVIEEGVKLDNLIQIGHNCIIGAHTVIAGCVGIAGSARVGKHCKIGGAAMILGHLEIADHVTISPGSMITRSLTKAETYTALMPFQTHKEWLNTAAKIRHLDEFTDKLKNLEQEIALLRSQHKN